MKTQKQLPKEFTFICDENSIEQLEKLGVDYQGWGIESIPCEVKGFYFQIYNYVIVGGGFDGYEKKYDLSHAPLINLADYIEQEQPEQKWQEKTRGGKKILDIKETINGHWVVNAENYAGNSELYLCFPSGINTGGNPNFDLLPINNELTTLEKELEEVREKEKQILEKIERLKTK